ncbi:hypothetical protein FHU37_000442 [Allostreptomyces psammosilenae]|uniref:T4 beta protein n=1 Tax=Allostreptomyces psammosilenae TaxID=1892865 RepID=A0A852ZM74_9ACTN|nr:hypothetical protein [Allostreptomyces psammosilenae]
MGEELWRLLAGSGLRPVTGPDREFRQQIACAKAAWAGGRGLGVRVLLGEPPDERLSDSARLMLRRLGLPAGSLDLLLDLGAVTDEHHQADKRALLALDLLLPLTTWRTVAVISGAFPRSIPDHAPDPFVEFERHDWDVWHLVRDSFGVPAGDGRPPSPSAFLYGDYGAQHTRGCDEPSRREGGPPWGVLRYTTERTFLLCRFPTDTTDRARIVRAAARRIVGCGDFRGHTYSAGDRWLYDCARGFGSRGSGNAEGWLRHGHVQHMTHVVDRLGAVSL